jgi:shikimate dehydrogenase
MKPRWAAVVGYPVRHSLSPAIFREICRATGRNLEYKAVTFRGSQLAKALDAARYGPWVGWNVTLPHKERIMDMMDSLSPDAMAAGAVNCVEFRKNHLVGHNTDVTGFTVPLKRAGVTLPGKKVALLGAGGAARAVCLALKKHGVGDVFILNRTLHRAAVLSSEFSFRCTALTAKNASGAIEWADIVVNATSAGLDGRSSPLPRGTTWSKPNTAYDLIYRPRWTPFLKTAERAGCTFFNGLGMLVAQAAESWRIWTGARLPERLLERVEWRLEVMVDA